MIHDEVLRGVSRCPHCGVAQPFLKRIWYTSGPLMPAGETSYGRMWGAYQCTSCGDVICAKGVHANHGAKAHIDQIYPNLPTVDEAVPDVPKNYLQQAFESLHAPDAAAMIAGSAVDAMLKEKGYKEGSVYTRIDKAVKDNVLTKDMGKWAHSVRLESNRPRHAD